MLFGSDGLPCKKSEDDGRRKASNRKALINVLEAWREEVHNSDPIGFLFDVQDIIEDDGLVLVANIPPSQLYDGGPNVIVDELDETSEWAACYAREIFEQIWRHDHGSKEIPMYK